MATARGPFRKVWVLVSRRPKRYKRGAQSMHPASIGKRAVELARKDIGLSESPPNSNRQKYGEYWDENGVPWCGLAVAYWWKHAGFNITKELAHKIDYVPELVRLAAQKKNRLALIHKNRVRAGDAVALDFNGGVADHVELFDRWISKRRGVFATIGGNTSRRGSQSNGGAVVAQVRRVNQVVAFVRKLP